MVRSPNEDEASQLIGDELGLLQFNYEFSLSHQSYISIIKMQNLSNLV